MEAVVALAETNRIIALTTAGALAASIGTLATHGVSTRGALNVGAIRATVALVADASGPDICIEGSISETTGSPV